jgi:hypothetical protein
MYVDGRELTEYSNPVSSDDLREGEIYFALNFSDAEMLVPLIETIVFIGRNLEPGDSSEAYFQDLTSFKEGVPYEDTRKATFYSGSMDSLSHIFTYEQLLNELLKCSLRRSSLQTPDSQL